MTVILLPVSCCLTQACVCVTLLSADLALACPVPSASDCRRLSTSVCVASSEETGRSSYPVGDSNCPSVCQHSQQLLSHTHTLAALVKEQLTGRFLHDIITQGHAHAVTER